MIRNTVSEGSRSENVGARLKRLRLQRGFSQRDLSSPGVSYAYISRIEAGARTPSVKALRKLAQKLGVSVEYLETGRDLRDVDDRVLEADGILPTSRPDVYATLGQSYASLGAPERAVRLFERCIDEIADQPEHATTRIWFATLLSYALTDANEYERAHEVVRKALAVTNISLDPYSRMRLYWSKARLAAIEGRSAEALESIREAIALLKTTDDTLHLARAYLMSAGIETNSKDVDTARLHLANARELLGPAPQPIDRTMLLIGESRVAALERNADAAVEHARTAIDILGSEHAGQQGAAVWALAAGLALQGETNASIDSYRRAVDLLSVHGQRHDAGTAALEWAELLREHGRAEEAEPVLRRAYDLGVSADTAPAAG